MGARACAPRRPDLPCNPRLHERRGPQPPPRDPASVWPHRCGPDLFPMRLTGRQPPAACLARISAEGSLPGGPRRGGERMQKTGFRAPLPGSAASGPRIASLRCRPHDGGGPGRQRLRKRSPPMRTQLSRRASCLGALAAVVAQAGGRANRLPHSDINN